MYVRHLKCVSRDTCHQGSHSTFMQLFEFFDGIHGTVGRTQPCLNGRNNCGRHVPVMSDHGNEQKM